MSKYLTAAGWKNVVKESKGKVADNGLQKALEKYESRPEDKLAARMDDLKAVFKLALALNDSRKKLAYAPAAEYLSKVCEASVKKQEELDADKKAAAVSAGEKMMLQNMIIQSATNVSTNAKVNAGFFGRQVAAACVAFESYAAPKAEEVDEEGLVGSLVTGLLGIVTGGVSNALMSVVDPIAKKIAAEFVKVAQSQMTSSLKGGGKDLEQAIRELVQGATDTATAMESVVTRMIVPECKKVIDGVNSGKRLSPQLTAFIEPFIRQDPSSMDKLLESRFGVPTPERAKQVQVKIYRDMVQRFEEARIKAQTSSPEKMEWVVTGVPEHVHRNAEARANQAGKQRERELTAAERRRGL